MPQGYVVILGDKSLGVSDDIAGAYTSFTSDTDLGSGDWTWSGIYANQCYTDEVESGQYHLETDGNVYFVPDNGAVDNLTNGSVANAPSFTAKDGAVDGTDDADYITFRYADAENDAVDNGMGGGLNGTDDLVTANDGDDSVYSGSGNDTVYGGEGKDFLYTSRGDDLVYGDSSGPGSDTPSTVTINASNVGAVDQGFSVSAISAGGATDTISYFADGFGVSGTISDSDGGVQQQIGYDKQSGQSEKLQVDLDDPTDYAAFSFQHLQTSGFGEEGHWAVYNDGVLVAEGDFTEDGAHTGSGDVTISNVGEFDQIVFSANLQTDGTDGSDYVVTEITFDVPAKEPEDHDDTIYGDSGNDTIYGEGGDDSLFGGTDNDVIDGGSGDDSISGDEGDDNLQGGTGNDWFAVGEGDTATGGDDDDYFELQDIETGNDIGTIYVQGGEGGSDYDSLDFNGLLDPGSLTITSTSNDGTMNGTADLLDGTHLVFTDIERIICFEKGTRIRTLNGARAIETLQNGDRVLTRDHGPQPIRWVGQSTFVAEKNLAPAQFAAGFLGNKRALNVSPQHRMLIKSPAAALLFGAQEILASARHLVNGTDIIQLPSQVVTYVHLMFDQEIIYAEGAPTESLFPGSSAIENLPPDMRDSLFQAHPELRSGNAKYTETARLCLTGMEARTLLQYNPPELMVPKLALGPKTAVPPLEVVT